MKTRLLCGILAIILVGCVDQPGDSGSAPGEGDIALAPPYPNIREIASISPVAFTGVVSGVQYGSHDHSSYPFTFVRFSGVNMVYNNASLKMDGAQTLTISYAGGMLPDNTRLEFSEQPSFEIGAWYLVFLRGGAWRLSPHCWK